MAIAEHADGTLVVVTTGEEARIFTLQNGNLQPQASWTPGHLADQGPSGKTPPDMSDQDLNEATFSKIIAEKLYAMAHANEFRHLMLIADPRTLGEIRPLLHEAVTSRLILEQAKTLINATTEDIEKSIQSRN